MQIKLVTGCTIYEAAKNTIKEIDPSDTFQNIVVVPDAFSMQAESLIFDCLEITSTFGIEVVGISRLASKILRDNNIAFGRISALEEVFNIFEAVKQCESDFQYFSTGDVDFCIKILQIIKQFKSCGIKASSIKDTKDEMLNRKMHDLKLIYIEYEKLLGEKLDLSKLLDFFLEQAENKLDFSNINLFFVNFDSFTLQINDFICRLAKRVNKVCIGVAQPLSPANAYIYENDILHKTTEIAKKYSQTVQVQKSPCLLKDEQKDLVENLFAFNIKPKPSPFFLNVMAKNAQDEVDFVAKYIKKQVFEGKRFKDFAVAVSNEKYFNLCKSKFSQFNICCNYDTASNLSETILGHFILKILEFANLGCDQQAFNYLASSPLLQDEETEKVLKDIFFFDVRTSEEFVQRFPQFDWIVESVKCLSFCSSISEFCDVLQSVLKKVEPNFEILVASIDDFKKQSENKQSVELLSKTLEKLCELGAGKNVILSDFVQLLQLSLSSVKVETVPTYIDAVFVGDATDSYFGDVDTLFILGATADSLPRTKNDISILDDDDIKKLKVNFVLEPEIRVLNRRSRLKLFELLQHAKKKLVVCVPQNVDKTQTQKAEFVENLQMLFGKNTLHTAALENFDVGIFSEEENLQQLLMFLGDASNLSVAYSHLKAHGKLPKAINLSSLLKEELPQEKNIETINMQVLGDITKLSPSGLETYFSCPLRYLLSYGMELQPKESILADKRHFGIFQHDLLKLFVQTYSNNNTSNVGNVTESELDKFLSDNFLELANKHYDEKVLTHTFLRILKNESKIILKNVIKEQKISKFRPTCLEQRVFVPLDEDVVLNGIVDRVDECENYFRIIDYKTGEVGSLESELYYGKKLQLFLYARAVKKKLKKQCAGVYYFNCQSHFGKFGQKQKLMKGLTLKENKIVEFSDNCTDQSGEVLGFAVKKSAKEGEFAFKDAPVTDNLDEKMEYALKVSKKAFEEISQGYVAAKPFGSVCDFCPYIAICRHSDAQGCRKPYKKTKKDE